MISKQHSGRDPGYPVLKGLVLAGGRSSRMGRDKSSINYHGRQQHYYMAELLRPFCADVFISCRREQRDSIAGYNTIPDFYEGMGPLGALHSAFASDSSCAWLAVACDLPLLDARTLALLVARRNPSCMATTFRSPHDGLPEPLVTIWEPKSHEVLSASLETGHRCPRKALINHPVNIIECPDKEALMNVNTPQDYEIIQQLLQKKIINMQNE